MKESPYLKGQDQLIAQFRKIPFLQSFEEKYLREILALSKIRKYEPDEVIIQEGLYDCWIYLLLSGEVTVVKHERQISRLDRPGDVFGELSVIDGEARSASVHAVTAVTCLAVDGSFMDRAEEGDENAFSSVLYRMFTELLANRLRNTSEELALVKERLEMIEMFVEKKWY